VEDLNADNVKRHFKKVWLGCMDTLFQNDDRKLLRTWKWTLRIHGRWQLLHKASSP
jgi:hypothetical protein